MCATHAKLCNSCKKKLIDEKLRQCASLYTNLGMESTDEERSQAKSKEQEILYEIMAIDQDKGERLLNIG